MAQASQSHLSRYHPAVLSIAGLGAAYGIYALYTAYAHRPTANSLQRSNAVHRPRRDRQPRTLDWTAPTEEAPLGTILIRQNTDVFMINLATTQIPTGDQLRMFGSGTSDLRRELQSLVLDVVLASLCSADPESDTWSAAQTFGLENILSALSSRDIEGLLRAASEIPAMMNLDTVGPEQVQRAVNAIVTSPDWLADPGSTSEDREPAETEDLLDVDSREPSQGLRGLLYYIAEDDAKRKAYEHRGINCEGCGVFPIQGIRYHCLNCPDFDLCSSCEAHTRHPKTHVFAKIKIPLPVLSQPTKEYRLWYPGDPRKVHPSLDLALKKRLCNDHKFEEPQMEAIYDQFTVVANVQWQYDALSLHAAIDRRAFDRAMTSHRWPKGFATNAMFDRMFAFYDTDGNGVITLDEFVSGMAYLRGPQRFASLRRCVQGYDMDGDGYVSRDDFLRLLRAKFAIQKQLVSDSIDSQEMERTLSGLETLRTSQPISSIFSQEDIPLGETRRPRGKQANAHGDMVPLLNTPTLLDDDAPFPRSKIPSAQERLRTHLSRFEEMLYSTGQGSAPESPAQVHDVPSAPRSEGQQRPVQQVLDVPNIFPDHEHEPEDPFVQDVMWQITEEGFNSLLDSIFKGREDEDAEVVSTRARRTKWRAELDAEAEARRRLREQLIAAASDPLMATALSSSTFDPAVEPAQTSRQISQPADVGDIVPTDWENLSRREAEISDARLDDLLNATGYGIRGESGGGSMATDSRPVAHSAQSTASGDSIIRTSIPSVITEASSNAPPDPTLPQHKPNSVPSTASPCASPTTKPESENPQASPGSPPSKRELRHLVHLDNLERGLEERGGPGRLTYDEVEHITVAQNSQALRGLIKSWLEYASF